MFYSLLLLIVSLVYVFLFGYLYLGLLMLVSLPLMGLAMSIQILLFTGGDGGNTGKVEHNEGAEKSAGALVGEVVTGIRTVASFNAEQKFYGTRRTLQPRTTAAGHPPLHPPSRPPPLPPPLTPRWILLLLRAADYEARCRAMQRASELKAVQLAFFNGLSKGLPMLMFAGFFAFGFWVVEEDMKCQDDVTGGGSGGGESCNNDGAAAPDVSGEDADGCATPLSIGPMCAAALTLSARLLGTWRRRAPPPTAASASSSPSSSCSSPPRASARCAARRPRPRRPLPAREACK